MNEYLNELYVHAKKYEKQAVNTLLDYFNLSSKSKSKNYMLAKAIIYSYEGESIAKTKIDFNNINVKTIQLKENGYPQEAMSFPCFDFCKIVNETWETSSFRKFLERDFLFFVFKRTNGINILFKVMIWKVPLKDLDSEIKLVWEDTKSKVANGNVIKKIENGKVFTTFMPEKDTSICHVRPHGSNGSDLALLPVSDIRTGYNYALKESFWFNHEYIKKIVEEDGG